MKLRMKSSLLIVFLIVSHHLFGQGTLSGTIIDKSSGDALAGVNIRNQENNVGTISGADGSFSLQLHSGDHLITMSMIGYAEVALCWVNVDKITESFDQKAINDVSLNQISNPNLRHS